MQPVFPLVELLLGNLHHLGLRGSQGAVEPHFGKVHHRVTRSLLFSLSTCIQNLLESVVLVADPPPFFSLIERNIRMKRSFGLLLALLLVVGCSDSGSSPAPAPESGSSTAVGANLNTVVFNVPGMT